MTPITDEARRALYQAAEQHWVREAEHYGYDMDRPVNVTAKMQAILGAGDAETAAKAFEKCKHTIQVMILGAWARGQIDGPTNVRTLEKKIKKAESLAHMLEGKGLHEQADAQWDRVEELHAQLRDLDKG